MVNYVLVIDRSIASVAEKRGHRVYCHETIEKCITIPPSNSEAHRFHNKYSYNSMIYEGNPDEIQDAIRQFTEIAEKEKIKASDIIINEGPLAWSPGSTKYAEDINESVFHVIYTNFEVYSIVSGNTLVDFKVDITSREQGKIDNSS